MENNPKKYCTSTFKFGHGKELGTIHSLWVPAPCSSKPACMHFRERVVLIEKSALVTEDQITRIALTQKRDLLATLVTSYPQCNS
ncbi:hypothetical protein RvY_04520 [Ramazzottius varieornatus]|uniref:Uncharacterized protein n=1 Tax=Ramazzottius varieornatus TaxID=947166 RepID=A0A1D1UV91_RAMVA|nr:hypothetical protein RvY_04520 [Ramazzottius varieornatus]